MKTKSLLQIADRADHSSLNQTGNGGDDDTGIIFDWEISEREIPEEHDKDDEISRLKEKLAEKNDQIMELQDRCEAMAYEIQRKDSALSFMKEKLNRVQYINQHDDGDDAWII